MTYPKTMNWVSPKCFAHIFESGGAGGVAAAGSEAVVGLAEDNAVVEVVDREAPKVTHNNLEDVDGSLLT